MFKTKIDIKLLYVFVVISSIIQAIAYVFIFDCKGNYFYFGAMDTDPGGDFYLSLLYSSKLRPYDNIFPYPPITVIFCYIMRFITHDVLTLNADTTNLNNSFVNIYSKNFDYQNMFFILTIFLFLVLFYFIYTQFKKTEKNEIKTFLLSILCLCNSGLLCALVRGNFLLYCLLFILIFCITHDKNDKVSRYISIVSLAIAFNIKSYAAIFGVLYLYDKKYKDAVICAGVSLILFFIPFFFLSGGFFKNIIAFAKQLTSFGNSGIMIGFSSFVFSISNELNIFTNNIVFKLIVYLSSIIICLLLILSGRTKNCVRWKKILSITLVMIILPTNFGYILSFMLIPIVFFLKDEEKLSMSNLLVLMSFLFLTAPFFISGHHVAGIRLLLCNIVLLFLSIYLIYDCLICKKSS